jgi:two-component system chemotaxis response regulator CheY
MLISSETRFRYLDPIRQAGAIAILPKPFSQEELQIALNATLDHLDPESLYLEHYDPENVEVLIVDDSPLARKHILRVLTSMGLERFTEAKDGIEAMELIADTFFDLIVTDYNMPRMSGKELVEHIRSGSSQASVPILMVTSEQNENRLAAVQQAGISAICDKPFEPESVRRLVEQALSEH